MKILWVTFGLPYPPDTGFRQRDFHLIREVSRHAEIVLFSLIPPGGQTEPGELTRYCARIETFSLPRRLPPLGGLTRVPAGAWRNFHPDAAARLAALAGAEQPEIVQVEHSLLAAYRDALPPSLRTRTVLSLHNVGFHQYRGMASLSAHPASRAAYRLKSWLMHRAETHYLPRYDACVTVSARESELLTTLLPALHPTVVENGVDCDTLRPLPPGGDAILFTGLMHYPPNADAAVFFCRSILPRIRSETPELKFIVAGHSPPRRVQRLAVENPHVEVTGSVADLRPYYEQAAVIVVPLRAGGGTRLKILESMALARPVVSTSIGCEGLEVEDGRHLLIADRPDDFAASVTHLLCDPALRRRLAASARQLVETRYDWPSIAQRLLALHTGLGAQVTTSR
jgi:glycosyltransferase involved in cell wall biosynthesis